MRTQPSRLFNLLFLAGTSLLPAQLEIASYTIDGGGGTLSGGSFSLVGTVGQPDASELIAGESQSLGGGFWSNLTPMTGPDYADWAAANIPVGLDASFNADANRDGIPNGIAYIFGDNGVEILGHGMLTAPPDVLPSDVSLTLYYSLNLENWMELTSGFTIEDGILNDLSTDPMRFYRYQAELQP